MERSTTPRWHPGLQAASTKLCDLYDKIEVRGQIFALAHHQLVTLTTPVIPG